MDQTQLAPLADILIRAYTDTAIYSRKFKDDYAQPPTTMAKVQHMLSIAQAYVTEGDDYDLCPEFAEYGKLQVVDRTTGRNYLVRSSAAVAIEDLRQPLLLPRPELETSVVMVVRKFHPDGLDLMIAGTRKQPDRQRLLASGPATFIATWPFVIGAPGQPFDQGQADPFGEVGAIAEDAEGDLQ